MAKKPTLTTGEARKAVREVLAIAPGWWKPLRLLGRGVREVTGAEIADDDLRAAVEWNLAEGYVRHRVNAETEEHEWNITEAGIAKEEIR